MQKNASDILNILLALLIVLSILVTYYTKVIKKDYVIFYSETGLPSLEE